MNACSIAHRKGRIRLDLAKEILREMLSLEIKKEDVEPLKERILDISFQYNRSAYNASYIALAGRENCDFITGDERLYCSVSKHFPFIKSL